MVPLWFHKSFQIYCSQSHRNIRKRNEILFGRQLFGVMSALDLLKSMCLMDGQFCPAFSIHTFGRCSMSMLFHFPFLLATHWHRKDSPTQACSSASTLRLRSG